MKRLCALVLLITGCDAAAAPPGVSSRPRGSADPVSGSTRVEAPEDEEPTPANLLPVEEPAADEGAEPGEPEPEAAQEAPAQDAPPERDLGAELQTAIGSPADCLATRLAGDGPAAIAITVTATVTALGMVTRAEASSGELSETEVACVRQRAQSARLRGPIEDAPRTISTTITLQRRQ